MSESGGESLLDRLVEVLATAMDAVGLNGRRVRWRWQQRRRDLGEASARGEQILRSAKARHKMCPACRALVDRDAKECPDCGESLAGVSKPGTARVFANLLPGVTAATSLLMLANGFWFVMMLMAQIKSAGGGGLGLFSSFDLELMVRFGAGLSEPRALSDGSVTGGEWWRLIAPIFLHGGILHFFFNSYLLLNLGPLVEEIYGTERFWVIYLTCGIAGSMASQLPRFVITVGASGAIMGLIGLLLVYGLRHESALGESMKSLAIRLGIYTLILSFAFNIDHLNHIGGLVCGGLLALVVPSRSVRQPKVGPLWQVLSLGGVLLVLLAFYHVAQSAMRGA